MQPRARDHLLFAVWVGWAAFVLTHYYVQVFAAIGDARLPSAGVLAARLAPFIAIAVLVLTFRSIGAGAPDGGLARRLRRYRWRTYGPGLLGAAAVLTIPWVHWRSSVGEAFRGLGVAGLPWLGEAAARAATALIGAALVGAAAVISGTIVLRLVGFAPRERSLRLVFAAASGTGVLAAASLALACAGLYRPLSVAILLAVLLAAGVPLARGSGGSAPPRLDSPAPSDRPLWIGITVVALAYALIGALAPEKEYDALWYHLQLPRLWLAHGQAVDVVEDYVSLYPLNWELVFAAGMIAGGPVAAKLLHFACLPLLALLVSRVVREFFGSRASSCAAAFLVLTPTLLWQASTTYVDLALALHSAAACYALARYAVTGERSWAALAAVQFGSAAATKHLGIVVAFSAVVVFVLTSRWRRVPVSVAIRQALAIALVAALVPAPWYVRSWWAAGNPVFPEMFALFGASPPERWDAVAEQGLAGFKARFGLGRSPGDLLRLPWNVTIHGALFGGSLGPLFLLLMPALLAARRRTGAAACLAGGVFIYLAVWASPVSSFQLRFLMPIVPALAVLAALGFEAVGERAPALRGARIAVTLPVALLAILNLPPFMPLHEADRVGRNGWLTHVLRGVPGAVVIGVRSEAEYLAREVPSFRAWQYINHHLAADARVLTFTGGDNLYANRDRLAHDSPVVRPVVWGSSSTSTPALTVALRRLRISHVLFDRHAVPDAGGAVPAIASATFLDSCTAEYDDGRYWLCRIGSAPPSPIGSSATALSGSSPSGR